jgi:drug/metabolite transporter superfamily protein YnfA
VRGGELAQPLIAVAAVAAIGGVYRVWIGLRDDRGGWVAVLGGLALAAFGVIATLQPADKFGRVLAAHGGVFIGRSLARGRARSSGVRSRYRSLRGANPARVTVTSRRTAASDGRLLAAFEGVQAVLDEFVCFDVVAEVAGLCALGQQVADGVADVLLRWGDVFAAVQCRELAAVVLVLDERVRMPSAWEAR